MRHARSGSIAAFTAILMALTQSLSATEDGGVLPDHLRHRHARDLLRMDAIDCPAGGYLSTQSRFTPSALAAPHVSDQAARVDAIRSAGGDLDWRSAVFGEVFMPHLPEDAITGGAFFGGYPEQPLAPDHVFRIEPGSLALFLGGLICLSTKRWRRVALDGRGLAYELSETAPDSFLARCALGIHDASVHGQPSTAGRTS